MHNTCPLPIIKFHINKNKIKNSYYQSSNAVDTIKSEIKNIERCSNNTTSIIILQK